MTGWPFVAQTPDDDDLCPFGYDLILADPGTRFENWSDKGAAKSPQSHYKTMTFEELAALPVGHLAKPDAILVQWATAPTLPQALELMRAWNFTYSTMGGWAKRTSTGRHWGFGTGYRFRNIRNLIVAATRGYSRKPDEIYAMCEGLMPGGRKCELFGRQRWASWDAWGNETDKFEAVEAAE